jgi:cell division protein ZipA
MPELRWILILFGAALLIGIYVWGRRNAKASADTDATMVRLRPEPAFDAVDVEEASSAATDEAPVDKVMDAEAHSTTEEAEPSASRSFASRAVEEADEPTLEASAARSDRESRYARVEPTFTEETVTVTAELHSREPEPALVAGPAAASVSLDAPTLSMSSTPQPRRIERRKIIALRLACPQRIPGAQLRDALDSERLAHGRYDVFHRIGPQGEAIFSVASMVEPGTFDLEKMPQESYPGITLFAQLPGPLAGMLALNELIACSKRLHAALGGTLQDERGVPLTVHRIERIRQEIREFEHRTAAEPMLRSTPTPTHSPAP